MRRISIALAAVTLVATSAALHAQAPAEEAAIPAPAANGVARLERRIAALESELEELKGRVSTHDDDLQTLAKGVLKNEEGISVNRDSIDANRGSIADVRRLVDDNNQKLLDISVEDPSNPGRYNIDLLGNMQRSDSFRREVRRTIKPRLRIYNSTGFSQHLYVNGTRWRVLPNTWSYAPVASGPVTVQKYANGERVVLNNWRHDDRGYNVNYDLWNHRELYSSPGDEGFDGGPPLRPVVSYRRN